MAGFLRASFWERLFPPDYLMKTNALLLLCLLGFFSTVKAGTWTVQPWTGDASTGIVNGETQWAYHFGSATSATSAKSAPCRRR
jgi:hypothetical protein